MVQVLQSSKVAPNGHSTRACRISLGIKTMELMDLSFGDFVAIVQDGDRFLIQKVVPND